MLDEWQVLTQPMGRNKEGMLLAAWPGWVRLLCIQAPTRSGRLHASSQTVHTKLHYPASCPAPTSALQTSSRSEQPCTSAKAPWSAWPPRRPPARPLRR